MSELNDPKYRDERKHSVKLATSNMVVFGRGSTTKFDSTGTSDILSAIWTFHAVIFLFGGFAVQNIFLMITLEVIGFLHLFLGYKMLSGHKTSYIIVLLLTISYSSFLMIGGLYGLGVLEFLLLVSMIRFDPT